MVVASADGKWSLMQSLDESNSMFWSQIHRARFKASTVLALTITKTDIILTVGRRNDDPSKVDICEWSLIGTILRSCWFEADATATAFVIVEHVKRGICTIAYTTGVRNVVMSAFMEGHNHDAKASFEVDAACWPMTEVICMHTVEGDTEFVVVTREPGVYLIRDKVVVNITHAFPPLHGLTAATVSIHDELLLCTYDTENQNQLFVCTLLGALVSCESVPCADDCDYDCGPLRSMRIRNGNVIYAFTKRDGTMYTF